MKTVSISELKAHLSKYVRMVRRGGEIQVLDRGVPVARLTGLGPTSDDPAADRERLVAAGVIRAGSGDASGILDVQPLQLPVSILEALEEERTDRI